MGKLLTISIAAYNAESTIKKALDSLIDKRIIDELEIFVVDDGGTDNTLKIAQEYAKKYPQSIFPVHTKNGGYGSTINTSISLATGKYFKLLDGDDWFHTENLCTLIDVMKSHTVDVILSSHIRHYQSGKPEEITDCYKSIPEGEQALEKSHLNQKLGMHDVAFSTKLLKNSAPITEHCFYTDQEFSTYPVPFLQSIYIFHRPVYVYQVGRPGQSMSAEGIRKHYKDATIVFKNLCNVYKSIPKENSVQKAIALDAAAYFYQMVIAFYCLLPCSRSVESALKRFSDLVHKHYPEMIDPAKQKSRRVKILESTHYLCYPILSLLTKMIW